MTSAQDLSAADYAVPADHLALAKMLDKEAFHLRTGKEKSYQVAAQLRLIADCLDVRRG